MFGFFHFLMGKEIGWCLSCNKEHWGRSISRGVCKGCREPAVWTFDTARSMPLSKWKTILAEFGRLPSPDWEPR